MSEPSTFSKRSAGPPRWWKRGSVRCVDLLGRFGACSLLTLSAIAEISRTGSTFARMRRSSPVASSVVRKSRRDLWELAMKSGSVGLVEGERYGEVTGREMHGFASRRLLVKLGFS